MNRLQLQQQYEINFKSNAFVENLDRHKLERRVFTEKNGQRLRAVMIRENLNTPIENYENINWWYLKNQGEIFFVSDCSQEEMDMCFVDSDLKFQFENYEFYVGHHHPKSPYSPSIILKRHCKLITNKK